MERDIPTAIVATTVSAYWLAVILMVARSWICFRGPAGVIPKVRGERWMWLLWVPNIVAWVALPWQAWDQSRTDADLPPALAFGRYVFALLAVIALGLTSRCWLAMGPNWSMAVNPSKPTSLITGGAFGIVRHPIYALSLLLMFATVATVASGPMLLVGVIHAAMIIAKTSSEERYLRQLHGSAYDEYCRQAGCYLPSLRGLLRISTRV